MLFAASPSCAITVVHVTLGVIFFAHGSQKVFGWFGGYRSKRSTVYFVSTELPLVVAYAVCFFELLGGIGLALGLLTRLAAMAIVTVMISAIAKVHDRAGFVRGIAWAHHIDLILSICGRPPALQFSRLDLNSVIKDGGAVGGGRGKRLSGLLVAAQVALAVVLPIAAAVMIRSFLNMYTADLGFKTKTANVLTMFLTRLPNISACG
jgi:uncharacterized membrane protein YphA (DoxX/SURF4 family)